MQSQEPRFDVFLSHNAVDKPTVQRVAEQLRARRLRPWLDLWMLVPGADWQDGLATGLRHSSSCAVFLGAADIGTWQRPEVKVALDRAMHDATFRVFLVLLPGMADPFDPTVIDPFLSMRTWVDLRAGAEDLASVEQLVRAVQGLPIEGAVTVEVDRAVPPYQGLLPFREADSAWFFGRDGDVQRLVEKLKTSQFLAVVGPSGCGKSSVTLAGLLPALRVGAVPGSAGWKIVVCTPGASPLESLAAALLEVSPNVSAPAVLDELCASDTALSLRARAAGARVVLVVDQAEEAFTLCTDTATRERFFGNLLHASTPGGPCTAIVTVRADFYPHAAAYPAFAQALSTHQYLVGPLGRDELRQVIEQPALTAGLTMQPGLVDVVLDDVGGEPGALPLLEHALLELWKRRQAETLTLAAYAETGGVAGAVSARADQIFASFTPIEQTAAKQVLLRLTQPGEGAEDTRRPATLAEMATPSVAVGDLERVVHTLADSRLVTTSGGDDPVVEVSHESLIRAWPRLRGWIEEGRDDLRIRQRISRAAAEWGHDRSDEGLWHGARLATALEWAATNSGELNKLETDFLTTSRRNEEAQARRRRRRLTTVIATLSVLTVMAVVLSLLTLAANRRASEGTAIATAQALAAQAGNVQAANPALALALAAESFTRTEPPIREADRALFRARDAFANRSGHAVGEPLEGHTGAVLGVAFASDGSMLASASNDATVRLWDPATGNPIGEPLTGHTDRVTGVAFNADGSMLASASWDRTVRLWNPDTGEQLNELTSHTGNGDPTPTVRWDPLTGLFSAGQFPGVSGVAFAADGTMLASADWDGTVRLWDPATGELLDELAGHEDEVLGVAFNADGTRLASAGRDHTIRLWDPDTGEVLNELTGHTDAVFGLTFSPDGTVLASAGRDHTVRLWDPDTGEVLNELTGHTDAVFGLTFNPDGTVLASAAADGTVRLWDLATGDPGEPLTGHTGPVSGVAFNADGARLASGGSDGAVRLWDPVAGDPLGEPLTGHASSVSAVAFNGDGTRLASADAGGAVRLWDPASGELVRELTGHAMWVRGLAFNADGTRLASASSDGAVRLWDPASGELVRELTGHTGDATGVAFSADGTLLASADLGGAVRLWDPASGELVRELTGHAGSEVAFNADGTLVASANSGGAVWLWDPASGELVRELTGHTGHVSGVAFNADGTMLASASWDRTVGLWAPATGDPIDEPLTGHRDVVSGVAFNADGTMLASASWDGTVRLWAPATGDPIGEPLTAPARPLPGAGHTESVLGVAFSPDGTLLASAGEGGTVRLWDAWDVAAACRLAAPYVVAEQVQAYLPQGETPRACHLD